MKASSKLKTVATLATGIFKAKIARFSGHTPAQNYILAALTSLGPGLPAKAAQLLSQRDSSVPPDLTALHLDKDTVDTILHAEVPQLIDQLQSFSYEALAGSLGEVHRAKLKDGTELAIKIQYPAMQSMITEQINSLFKLLNFPSKIKLFDGSLTGFHEFFYQKLSQELDYRHEFSNQMRFYSGFADSASIVIPKPRIDLSTASVFAQQWLQPVALASASAFEPQERLRLGRDLVRSFFEQLFVLHEIHGDIHAGNIGLTTSMPIKLILYDFGSTLAIDKAHAQLIARAIACRQQSLPFDTLGAFAQLGFAPVAIGTLGQKLTELWELFLEPFEQELNFDPLSWNFAERSATILGSSRLHFRTAGPPWFLHFMRSFAGLMSCLKSIEAPAFAWWPLLLEVLPQLSTANYLESSVEEGP